MKVFTSLMGLFAGFMLVGANLLPDPEFDKSVRSALCDMLPGNFKVTNITEDRTWNKACRIEYIKPFKKAGEPEKCFMTVLWSSEKDGGVKVKPNARYRFSMSVKGTIPQKSCYIQAIEWSADGLWKGRRRLDLVNSGNIIKFTAQPNVEQFIKGEFRTGSNAKRATFALTIRGTAKDNNMPAVGDYLIIDKISIEEVSNLPPADIAAPAPAPAPAKAVNLINDGDFAKSIRCLRSDMLPGNFKLTHDAAVQACRVVYVKPTKKEGKPDTCYLALAWGNEKDGGVKVKPGTRYRFAMTYRGTVPAVSCYVQVDQWSKPGFWSGRKRLTMTNKSNVIRLAPIADKSQTVGGEFITGSDAMRAAFCLTIRGNAKDNNMPRPGDYMLVEKVVIEEVVPTAPPTAAAVLPAAIDLNARRRVLEVNGAAQDGFTDLKSKKLQGAINSVQVRSSADALIITVQGAHSPRTDLTKGDMMEVIFDPSLRQGDIYHFLVSAVGKKSQLKAAAGAAGNWQAEITDLGGNRWQSVFTIPYAVLGLNRSNVEKGILIGFNAAVYRTQDGAFQSWNRIDNDFANPEFFGRILTGRELITREIAALRKKAAAKNNSAAVAEIDKLAELNDPALQLERLQSIEQAVARQAAGSRVFFLTAALPTTSPEVPVLPDYNALKDKINVTMAGDELRPEVLHLTNHTKNLEEYRISVFAPGPANGEHPLGATGNLAGTAVWGLKSADGSVFPAEQIQILRGVQVKDSEGAQRGLCFDPLTELADGIISVPAGGTGLLWLNFDSANVKPGIYKGVLRIVPLSQNLTTINSAKLQYDGRWQDFPLSVEVLDFKLPETPAIPMGVFSTPFNEKMFKEMVKLGVRDLHFEPWQFVISFNKDGSISKFNTERAGKNIRQILAWAEKYQVRDQCRIMLCYSFYPHFLNRWVAGKFKPGSPEWRRAWKESLLAVDGFFRSHGLDNKHYAIELWDEPPPAQYEQLLLASSAAKEFAPQIRLMVTFDARRLPVEKLAKLRRKIDIWNFWGKSYFTGSGYKELVEQLRQDGSEIAYYTCSTALRLNLNDYYRMHGHWSYAQNLGMTSIYQYIDAPHNYSGIANWRKVSSGGMAYLAGEKVVSSIRLECFRLGHTDIKYFRLLEDLLKANPNHPAAAAAKEFLQNEPLANALHYQFDINRPEESRRKCIEFIKQIKEKK